MSLALSTTIAVAQGNGHGHDKYNRDDDIYRRYDQDRDEAYGHGYGHRKATDAPAHCGVLRVGFAGSTGTGYLLSGTDRPNELKGQ